MVVVARFNGAVIHNCSFDLAYVGCLVFNKRAVRQAKFGAVSVTVRPCADRVGIVGIIHGTGASCISAYRIHPGSADFARSVKVAALSVAVGAV